MGRGRGHLPTLLPPRGGGALTGARHGRPPAAQFRSAQCRPDPGANPNLYAAVNGLAKIKGVVTTDVQDGPNKLFLGNIPLRW